MPYTLPGRPGPNRRMPMAVRLGDPQTRHRERQRRGRMQKGTARACGWPWIRYRTRSIWATSTAWRNGLGRKAYWIQRTARQMGRASFRQRGVTERSILVGGGILKNKYNDI